MSAKMTPTKRFVVRTALVTSTTLATIMGAQALASMDEASFAQQSPRPAQLSTQFATGMETSDTNVKAAAPNIVILRRVGQQPTANVGIVPPPAHLAGGQVNNAAAQILPPSPVQAVPSSTIFQTVPITRSSR